jgi:endonuclease/exonuclease/phosphatase family metal-dependent hydrolase
MQLTVLTYNVLYAFHERQGHEMIAREERAHAVREVVRAVAPDIVGLTEAAYCGLNGRILRPDYREMFGLEHVFTAGYEGEWANCLVSRYPILHAERLPLGRGEGRSDGATLVSAIRTTVDVAGCPLHIDVVHPSPKITEAERVEAMLPLLRTARRPYLLMGDFNALSDEDPYDHATLVHQLTGNVEQPEMLARRMLDRQLIAAVRAAGLIDTLAPSCRAHTLPTRLSRPGATQGAEIRIDYIFVSEELRVLRAEIGKSEAADRGSDHYPVLAVLELKSS